MNGNSRPFFAAFFGLAVLIAGCVKEQVNSPQEFGFSSSEEMRHIQAQGWRTKARYEADMRDARWETVFVACYGPYRHAANVAKAKGEPQAKSKDAAAAKMRQGLVQIWMRKGFDEVGAAHRVDSIYAQYPPGRPELYATKASSDAANAAGAKASRICDGQLRSGFAQKSRL